MLSYKKWKMLNEQFGGPITLGLKSPNQVAVVGAVAPTEEELEADNLEEGKKKKMLRDPNLDDEMGDDLGDELGDPDVEDLGDDDGECDCSCHDDEEEDPEGIEGPDGIMLCKKSAKKSAKKMTKEEEEWWSSVHDMTKFNDTKGWDGLAEDALLSPENPNDGLDGSDEPGPGEVGYAPQGKVGAMR